MKIYTTYFAKLKKLPADVVPVPISNSIPGVSRENTSYSYLSANKYKNLVPPWYVVKAYKENGDKEQYTKDYKRLVLDHLNPHDVVSNLKNQVGYNDVALVCYEKSDDFCHRHIVAEWLCAAGYDVAEWKEDDAK
jgi:uncharacterized protein YeaO (DUF488 family)